MTVVANPSPKKFPLLFSGQKFQKKVAKIIAGYPKFDETEAIIIGDVGSSIDEVEHEIL
jgi:hypothetical protein